MCPLARRTEETDRLLNPVRVLIISHSFPPLAEVGSIRIAQLAQYLPEHGVEPIVLSVQERFYDSLDHTRGLPPGLRVLRTPMMATPLDFYRTTKQGLKRLSLAKAASSGAATKNSPKDRGPLRKHLLALLKTPDPYWGWYFPAVRAAERLLREEHIDAIFSSGPPWISHLIARKVKAKFHVPWLADFRDPWESLASRRIQPHWWHRLAGRMEASCIERSNLVLCNTDRLRQAFQAQYPASDVRKFRTLTNGFEDLPILHVDPPKRRLLLHLGSIYARRRIDTFVAALAHLVASGQLPRESFQVLFQGDNDSAHQQRAAQMVPDLLQSNSVVFRPRISWNEAWQLLWQANLLLLFQGSHRLQIPAKFYEYLQTGIPIFAVAEDGALTDILSATESGVWASPDDPQAIAEKLMQALQIPRRSPEDVRDRLGNQYHYRGLAGQLSAAIREVAEVS